MFSDMIKVNNPPKNSVKATVSRFSRLWNFFRQIKTHFEKKGCLRSNRDINDRRRENLSPYKTRTKKNLRKNFSVKIHTNPISTHKRIKEIPVSFEE